MFAGNMAGLANADPARFVRLAMRFPRNCASIYPLSILNSLSNSEPRPEADDPDLIKQIEALIDRFEHLLFERDFAWAICWLVRRRHDAEWSQKTLSRIAQYAMSHEDPSPAIEVGRTGFGINDVAINCVRGAAAGAISSLLFHDAQYLQLLRPAVESLVNDPHPAVRTAAIGLALPLFNINRDASVETLTQACLHPDDRVLSSHELVQFLGFTILEYEASLRPLVLRMASSTIPQVGQTGARWAAIAWSHRGLFEDVVASCKSGSEWQRLGVAEAVRTAIQKGHDDESLVNLLKNLFNDDSEKGRHAASGVFTDPIVFERACAPSLAAAFASSVATGNSLHNFLLGVEKMTGSLRPYANTLCGLAKHFMAPDVKGEFSPQYPGPYGFGEYSKILLRLYEQSDRERAVRRECLDAWDALLKRGAGLGTLHVLDHEIG